MGAKGSTTDGPPIPASVRHKRILDIAADRPDAPMEDIAGEIPSATVELVERVLERYGDPAESDAQDAPADSIGSERIDSADAAETADGDVKDGCSPEEQSTESAGVPPEREGDAPEAERPSDVPEWDDLTPKQRKTLSEIERHPELTQREIGRNLGVTGATVCSRVSEIEGFEWSDRQELIDRIGGSPSPAMEEETTMATKETESDVTGDEQTDQQLDELTERVTALEQRLAASGGDETDGSDLNDPDLAHKILRLCFQSETISEAEERRIVHSLW